MFRRAEPRKRPGCGRRNPLLSELGSLQNPSNGNPRPAHRLIPRGVTGGKVDGQASNGHEQVARGGERPGRVLRQVLANVIFVSL